MPTDFYVDTVAYHLTLDRIVRAFTDPGICLRTDLIEILGDLGIWPSSCRPDSPPVHRVVCVDRSCATRIGDIVSLANAKAA